MPLGIVKDSDYENDLKSAKKEIPEVPDTGKSDAVLVPIEEHNPIGRGQGNTGVPQSIRKLIGESAIEEGAGAAKAIGEFLGLSNSSVSAYSKGATSTATYNKPDTELASHLDKTRKRITKKAQGKLFKALNVIDDDKLEVLSALEASTVAKNMAAIVKSMEPETRNGPTINGPVITFYAPHMVREDKFNIIDVNE